MIIPPFKASIINAGYATRVQKPSKQATNETLGHLGTQNYILKSFLKALMNIVKYNAISRINKDIFSHYHVTSDRQLIRENAAKF